MCYHPLSKVFLEVVVIGTVQLAPDVLEKIVDSLSQIVGGLTRTVECTLETKLGGVSREVDAGFKLQLSCRNRTHHFDIDIRVWSSLDLSDVWFEVSELSREDNKPTASASAALVFNGEYWAAVVQCQSWRLAYAFLLK